MTQTPTTDGTVNVPVNVPLTLTIDPRALLIQTQHVVGHDDDGDPIFAEGVGDQIVEAIARHVVASRGHVDHWTVSQAVKDAVRVRVEAMVEEAITRRYTPTDSYGRASGPETSIEDEIRAQIKAWIEYQPRPRGNSFNDDKTPCLKAYLADTVDKVARTDMDAALAAARHAVTARLKDRAAEALAATITSVAKGL